MATVSLFIFPAARFLSLADAIPFSFFIRGHAVKQLNGRVLEEVTLIIPPPKLVACAEESPGKIGT
jgi:hypothetical protein